jgi:DNA-binding transcriptional ArsR family regulator
MADKTNIPSKLRSLIVDSTSSDTEEMLFRALQNRVSFEKTTGKLLPRQGLFELDGKRRLIALFLARQARLHLELPTAPEEASATELASESQMPVKTVREYLSRLKSGGLIERRGDGYVLPSWNTLRAAEEVLQD